MAGYVALGALAAFGLLGILWASLGWLLPAGKGCALVCAEDADEGILSRYLWLRELGLLRCPLIIMSESESLYQKIPGVERVSPGALISRLKEERYGNDGTGNGDSSGRSERRGVSEL